MSAVQEFWFWTTLLQPRLRSDLPSAGINPLNTYTRPENINESQVFNAE